MALIADILLIAGALAASFYCFMLSRRLKRLNQLDTGVGGAISELTDKVSEMNEATRRVNADAQTCAENLEKVVRRAEAARAALEDLLPKFEDSAPEPAASGDDDRRVVPTAVKGNAPAAKFKPRFGPSPNSGEDG